MKTLFNNLLLNNRFVFFAGPEAPQEAPKPKAQAEINEDFDNLVKVTDKANKDYETSKEEGGKTKKETEKKVAELDIDKYIKPEARGASKYEINKLADKIATAQVDKMFGNIDNPDVASLLGVKTTGERKAEEREAVAQRAKEGTAREENAEALAIRLKTMDKQADNLKRTTDNYLTTKELVITTKNGETMSTSFDKLAGKQGLGEKLAKQVREINDRYKDDPVLRLQANKEIHANVSSVIDAARYQDADKIQRVAANSANRAEETIKSYS